MSSSSSSSVSKKAAATFVVQAESMGSAAALKDQAAGLWRWEDALRSLCQSAPKLTGRAVPVPISSSSQAAVNGSASAASSGAGGRASRSKQSREEKLHKAYHLVCWGPN